MSNKEMLAEMASEQRRNENRKHARSILSENGKKMASKLK